MQKFDILPSPYLGARMQGPVKERWKELCEQAVVEQDPQKLYELIAEINKLLDEKFNRLKPKQARRLKQTEAGMGQSGDSLARSQSLRSESYLGTPLGQSRRYPRRKIPARCRAERGSRDIESRKQNKNIIPRHSLDLIELTRPNFPERQLRLHHSALLRVPHP